MSLFSAEQISLMPFYYVQDVCQKNQLGTILDKRHMIPGAKIISRKVGMAIVNGDEGSGERCENFPYANF